MQVADSGAFVRRRRNRPSLHLSFAHTRREMSAKVMENLRKRRMAEEAEALHKRAQRPGGADGDVGRKHVSVVGILVQQPSFGGEAVKLR